MPPTNFSSYLTRPRIYAYSLISTFAALATIAIAFEERANFYAAVVFLGRSNKCLLVLLNFLLVVALVAGRILQLLYFGQLRRSEVELVCERSWYSLVSTLLAVSIFRDDFSVSFVILFGVLLFLKIFHWLSAERVASIMQSPSVPRIFHARMVSILTTLLLADLMLVGFSLHILLVKKVKVGMMVLFTSEFIILTALLGNTIAQYVLNCIDMAREEPWEAKSLYVLYVELVHDVVRLCTHGYFFVLLTRMYGIPLSLIHDLYSAGRSCMVKVKALVRYRQAVRKMETKYPDASAADLEGIDGTCIICREDMVADGEGGTATTPKKLGCGHIFHFRCLRSWLERQQSCPTCRRMILEDEPEGGAGGGQQAEAQAQAAQQGGAPARPEDGAGAEANGGSSSRQDPPSTAAEQAYDSRLQEFIQRLQSDLRKVRQEGNTSARHASRRSRTTGRSGQSTPRSAAAAVHFGQPGGSDSGMLWSGPRSGSSVAGRTQFSSGAAEESNGGLWMPPPPSSLFLGGRRPVAAARAEASAQPTTDADAKGKGKAREPTDDPVDPVDPREAIRQATLKRFGQPTSTTSTSNSAATTEAPISMIPLFDPSSVPDFASRHAPTLPHPLLNDPAIDGDLQATLHTKTSAVKQQIELLTSIQSRIDGVIADLTRVLDVVGASSGELNQQAQGD